jgi:AraC family transcriptional activator of pobA
MSDIPKYEFDPDPSRNLNFEISRIEDKPVLLKLGQQLRRDNFYVVFLIEQGTGVHTIDFEHYAIAPNTMFCIAPGQIRYWHIDGIVTGWAILFTEEFLTTQLAYNATHFPEDFTLFNWDTPSGLTTTETLWTHLQTLCLMMATEYHQLDALHQRLAIQSTLLLLLISAERLWTGQAIVDTSTLQGRLVREFLALVNTNFQQKHRVQDYAQQLGVTAGHLSDTVSDVLGETPQKIIHKRIILEAKRLLIHTNLPASTIATMLSFSDASYFGRFFKREVGQTAHVYRRNFR